MSLCQPWKAEYAGEDAAGAHVVALWHFNSGGETEDASGHGHAVSLQDGKWNPEGRFGACLESFPGWPVEDTRHRALAADHPDLSPPGAFTIEMWVCPKPELDADYPDSFLLDKKYVADDDYQLILGRSDRAGARVLRATLGFGDDSSTYYADPARFEPGTWHHLAFTYDGEGTGSFYIDGLPWGSRRIDGRKGISPGRHALSIGDRIGSLYHGFPGLIDEVRISTGVLEFRWAGVELASDRHCFVRRESPATLRLKLTNFARDTLVGAAVTFDLDGFGTQQTKVADLGPGESKVVEYPVDTSLRPDSYRLTARLAVDEPEPRETRETIPIRIVARRPPHQFPVLMWGVYGGVSKEAERLKRIGFTHVLGFGADYGKIFDTGQPTEAAEPEKVEAVRQSLDEALANDLTLVASLSPGAAMRGREKFRRIDRKGKPYKSREDICGLFPELRTYCYNVGASVANTYGHFPAFGAAMIHTEVRGHARPCFHPHDVEAFRKLAGIDIPAEVHSPRGISYTKLADFPADRAIADDHPIYVYYRWYWKQGDGWNALNTAVHEGLKSSGRDDLWTYHDPAARVAKVYGSGGAVDVLSQWTYSYPDPIRIGLATDELLALAGGAASKQQVMKMTQIIWYRGQTAPAPKKPEEAPAYQARWELEQPAAPFITIAPMHLREAFWTKIARPIRGIMYHGWQSLVPCESPSGYRYTHPQTQHELARLVRQVVRPLGPTLLQVPGVTSDVVQLQSFASEMFAKRGTFGWGGGWAGDVNHALQYAHLQPEIVYDETILEGKLDDRRLLVMADCDVITQGMAKRIKAFQAAGGLVVGDERLAPAIRPDVVLPVSKRTGRADEDKAALVALAADLRKQLEGRYQRYVDTTSPEVIPYRRRSGTSDYVFLVNDRREFGQYVGHHGIVMENGLPTKAVLSVARPDGFVYDLVESRQVPARAEDGKLLVDVQLGPCDGRLLMITDRAVADVDIEAPEQVPPGKRAECTLQVVDAEGKPLDAVVPVEVTIFDPETRRAEGSGYYGATGGRLQLGIDVAKNDSAGIWQVRARELATGREAVHYFRVPLPEKPKPSAQPEFAPDPGGVQPQG